MTDPKRKNMFTKENTNKTVNLAAELMKAGKPPSITDQLKEELSINDSFVDFEIEIPEKIVKSKFNMYFEQDLIDCLEEDAKKYGSNSFLPNKILRHYYKSKGRLNKK